MPEPRHLTTRRRVITALGFAPLSLYGVWAAYGAAPLPFGGAAHPHEAPEAHDAHADAEPHQGPMTPARFRVAHDAFITQYRKPDGSVEPPAPVSGAVSMPDMPDMPDMPGMAGMAATRAVDVYLLAYRWGYLPDVLRLIAGVPYRFRMMADDITHGAAIQLGAASHVVRLRPNSVTEQTLTFTRPGEYLIYCTVYCGMGHDAMQGRIVVRPAA